MSEITITKNNFEKEVMKSDKPVLIDFWAGWCGPCRMVSPILEKIAKDYADKLIVAKVNTDENQEWAGKYHVEGIPTMLMIAKGKIVHRQVGAVPEPMLREIVDQFLDVVNSQPK